MALKNHFTLQQIWIFFFCKLFVYLLKNCFSQFFSTWESAEPVFCCKELSCLPYKNQNKSLALSFGEGKFKFAVLWGLFIKPFFHWATFMKSEPNDWSNLTFSLLPCRLWAWLHHSHGDHFTRYPLLFRLVFHVTFSLSFQCQKTYVCIFLGKLSWQIFWAAYYWKSSFY